MDKKQASMISDRIRAAAEGIVSKPEQGEIAVYSCLKYLTKAAGRLHEDYLKLDNDDYDVVLNVNRDIVRLIEQFMQKMQNRQMTSGQQETVKTIESEISEIEKLLASERADIYELRKFLEQAKTTLEVVRKTKIDYQNEVTEKQDTIETLNEETAVLQTKSASMTLTIDEKQNIKDKLVKDVSALTVQVNDLSDSITNLTKEFDDLNGKIQSLPEELKTREKAYSDLEEKYQRIKNAEVECSDEKWEAMEKEIASLEPKVQDLREKYEKVKQNHDAITAVYNQQLDDNVDAEKQIFDVIDRSMDNLEVHSEDLSDRLTKAKERCKQFEANLNECQKAYTLYHTWLESLVQPVEAMSRKAGLSPLEYKTLYATLDPSQCETIDALMERTRKNLNELDKIIQAGMLSAAIDQKITQKRAEESEEAARRYRMENPQ